MTKGRDNKDVLNTIEQVQKTLEALKCELNYSDNITPLLTAERDRFAQSANQLVLEVTEAIEGRRYV